MVYQWRTGYNYKASPEIAAKVMTKLAKKGQLNANSLVEVSRPVSAPLHDDFEWDDTKAADNWRKQQGRNMINSLIMIPEEKDHEDSKGPVRAFFKVEPLSRKEQYESTQVLIRTQSGRDAMRDQAQKELVSYRQKYRNILEWTGADVNVEQAIQTLEQEG